MAGHTATERAVHIGIQELTGVSLLVLQRHKGQVREGSAVVVVLVMDFGSAMERDSRIQRGLAKAYAAASSERSVVVWMDSRGAAPTVGRSGMVGVVQAFAHVVGGVAVWASQSCPKRSAAAAVGGRPCSSVRLCRGPTAVPGLAAAAAAVAAMDVSLARRHCSSTS